MTASAVGEQDALRRCGYQHDHVAGTPMACTWRAARSNCGSSARKSVLTTTAS